MLTVQTSAQLNEGFESYTTLNQLTNNCWSFVGVGFSTTTGISGTHSLQVIPTTSGGAGGSSNTAQIITPFINFTASTNLTFDVKLSNDLASQANRNIKARLLDQYGVYSSYLAELVLDKSSTSASAYTVIVPVNVTGQRKLVVDITGSGDGNTYVYVDNIIYSGSMVGCTANAPLPVRLLDFGGNLVQNRAQLKWTVAENEEGNHFEVEKSTTGSNFSSIGLVFTTNRVGIEVYTFGEGTELMQDSYYRIKMLNNDGSYTYSRIIALKSNSDGADNGIDVMQNPIQSTLTFSYNASTTGQYFVTLFNMNGARVYTTAVQFQAGPNSISLNIGDRLTGGTYVLEITNYKERRTTKVNK